MAAKRGQSSLQQIGDVLAQAMGGSARPVYARKAKQYALWEQWAQLVGPQLAAKTRPLKMQDTTLVITASSHAWVQQLTFLVPELLRKIHQVIDPALVTAIRVVTGRAAE